MFVSQKSVNKVPELFLNAIWPAPSELSKPLPLRSLALVTSRVHFDSPRDSHHSPICVAAASSERSN